MTKVQYIFVSFQSFIMYLSSMTLTFMVDCFFFFFFFFLSIFVRDIAINIIENMLILKFKLSLTTVP